MIERPRRTAGLSIIFLAVLRDSWENGRVKRLSVAKRFSVGLVLVGLLLAAPLVAEGGNKRQSLSQLNVTFRIDQGVTHRHARPPAGDKNDVFSVILTLINTTPGFGKNEDQRVGQMTFSYVLHGFCSDAVSGACKGTVDVETMTKLPGGTISAIGKAVPIRAPFVVTVRSGTGRYKGVSGKIIIAPEGQARNVYQLKLP
jgi:hypothetical protein